MIILLSETERVHKANGNFQIERRYEWEGSYEWRAFEYHGTAAEAISAAAYREIRRLPNDDLAQWYEASSKILARYEQILVKTLEYRQSGIGLTGTA